jgi:hypothetical protein
MGLNQGRVCGASFDRLRTTAVAMTGAHTDDGCGRWYTIRHLPFASLLRQSGNCCCRLCALKAQTSLPRRRDAAEWGREA